MATVIAALDRLTIPNAVTNINAFREWNDAADFPSQYQVWWLCGEVWADLSKEQIFSHNLLKTRLAAGLMALVDAESLGVVFGDGILLSNFAADVSGNPDGMFISSATYQSDRVRLIEGKEGGFVELQGSPDVVLEVVSTGSVHKDTVALKEAYWLAGVREYWLIDARADDLQFDIFRHGEQGYTATRKQRGWVKSAVFGRSFRVAKFESVLKHPDFRLEHR